MRITKNLLLFLAITTASTAAAGEKEDTVANRLSHVVVTGTRYKNDAQKQMVTVTTLSREKLTESERISLLPTLNEMVPGLFATQRGMMGFGVSDGAAGGFNIRGIDSGNGRVLVLIDGHPQYQGVFGHSIADAYQTMMADKVEVVRGPASVLYGSNAMGGVINIITRGMHEDGVRTNVSVGGGSWGTFQAEASNQVKAGRFTSTIAAQYAHTDGHRERMEFEQFGGYVKLGYELSSKWNIFGDLDITHFNANNPVNVGFANGDIKVTPLYDATQSITRGVATLGVENNYGWTNGRISVYDNFGIHKINDGYGPGKNNNTPQTELFRSKDALIGASWYQTARFFKGNNLTVGFDYQHIYGHAYYTSIETGEVVTAGKRGMQSADKSMNEYAGYINMRQDFGRWVTLEAGVRYDYHSVAGGEWIPGGGIVVRPIRNGVFKATATRGFRNPTTKEMYLYGTKNDSLRAESMWNYEIAWQHSVAGGKFNYGINLYMLKAKNMIQTVAGKNINTGELNNKGIEVEATWNINKHWTLTTNHSYLNMERHIAGAPEYKGYLGCDMRYGKWQVIAGVQQLCNLYTYVASGQWAEGKSDPKQDVTLVNATLNFQACKQVKLWLRGENLLAQKYEFNAGYTMPRATIMGGIKVSF